MFGVVHDVGREGVEGEEVRHLNLLLSVVVLRLANHVGVDNFVSREQVVLYFFVSVVELHHVFAEWRERYERPSFRSLATPKTSPFVIGLRSSESSSGML